MKVITKEVTDLCDHTNTKWTIMSGNLVPSVNIVYIAVDGYVDQTALSAGKKSCRQIIQVTLGSAKIDEAWCATAVTVNADSFLKGGTISG